MYIKFGLSYFKYKINSNPTLYAHKEQMSTILGAIIGWHWISPTVCLSVCLQVETLLLYWLGCIVTQSKERLFQHTNTFRSLNLICEFHISDVANKQGRYKLVINFWSFSVKPFNYPMFMYNFNPWKVSELNVRLYQLNLF